MKEKKLTIGMATFDDFEGVYFTIQSLRLNNLDRLMFLDFVVIDSNPDSREGKATKDFCKKAEARYFEEREWRSTACRDRIFSEAKSDWVLCIDPHILLEPDAIKNLLQYIENDPENEHLHHGSMLYDYLGTETPATHMDEEWRDNMYGTWGHSEEKSHRTYPIEIPMHGMGLFLCKVSGWEGFHPLFLGFGGEEGYIHKKFRKAGKRTLLIPWLKWVHRFQRPRGISYPLRIEERIMNYFIGWLELGEDPQEVKDHFGELHPHLDLDSMQKDAEGLLSDFQRDPAGTIKLRREKEEKVVAFEPEKSNSATVQKWNETKVDMGAPMSIDLPGGRLLLKSFGVTWSKD